MYEQKTRLAPFAHVWARGHSHPIPASLVLPTSRVAYSFANTDYNVTYVQLYYILHTTYYLPYLCTTTLPDYSYLTYVLLQQPTTAI